MKIFHTADLHFCQKHLKWVASAFREACEIAIREFCDLAVLAGDTFDAAIGLHEPAVTAVADVISDLSSHMPVLVLQGTYSHDRPGAIDILSRVHNRYQIYIADKVDRVSLWRRNGYVAGVDTTWLGHRPPAHLKCDRQVLSICVIPSLNRADPAVESEGAALWVHRQLLGFREENLTARDAGIPSILVAHGTVDGAITESNHAMVSSDHEFGLADLLDTEANAVMLGHIHKHQAWTDLTPGFTKCTIAYPGSIARLVYGHEDETGFLIWDMAASGATFEFYPVASRNMVDITFDGPPDMDSLSKYAAELGTSDHARIRWNIDQEHAASVDKNAIAALFSHCGGFKLEGTINPVQSIRAPGIGRAVSLGDKLALWLDTTGDSAALTRLSEKLEIIKSADPEQIVERIASAAGRAGDYRHNKEKSA